MERGLRGYLRLVGRIEQAFLVLAAIYAVLYFLGVQGSVPPLVALAAFILGMLALFRLARTGLHKLIWRLRNRLMVAYVFIAVVPIILMLALVGIAAYAVIGQVGVYLVNSELARRTSSLAGPAEGLARTPPANRAELFSRMAPMVRSRFPNFELLIRGSGEMRYPEGSKLTPPPDAWKDTSGLVVRDGRLYGWVHVTANGAEVTLAAPITHDVLADLAPGLGDVSFMRYTERARPSRIPPQANPIDFQVTGFYPVQLASWDSPSSPFNSVLIVNTRFSAVLGIVFGQKMQWSEIAAGAFAAVAILFLLVEVAALGAGVSLTRTITGAVHELYLGTQHVKEGDFSRRIPVKGNDQLAELSASFNTMTENLERLIVVAKEKERLQSELEIAREVQSQLFPKEAPTTRTLALTGSCSPARMVSGDYYDFMPVSDCGLAFAIGDVAGKGISAALLMAAIQSTMRTQLTAGIPAAGSGNGSGPQHLSAAFVVSQLNRQLYAHTSPEKYATFFLALYDEPSHSLTYTNAGHLPPILLRSGGNPELLEVTGTVVGAFPWAQYEEKTVSLGRGDLLLAYTDGIVEPENVYGEAFGEERLTEILVKHAGDDSTELAARIMEAVVQWTGSTELQDDMTVLLARRL